MKLITEIREQDIYPDAPQVDTSTFKLRESARAVVFDESGRVALLHVANRKYHKLPGGGVESGEDKRATLAREILEEIGCEAEVYAELGRTVEYRDQWQQLQTSDCYLARKTGAQQAISLTQEEIADGFEPIWVDNIDAAIALLKQDRPEGYDGERIVPRDLAILRAAKATL